MSELALQNYPVSAPLDKVEETLQKTAKVDWQDQRDEQDYTTRRNLHKYLSSNGIWPTRRLRRFDACGRPFDYISTSCEATATIRQYCHLYRVCPTCARIQRKRQEKAIKELVPKVKKIVDDLPNVAYQGGFLGKPLEKLPIVDILKELASLSKLEGITVPTYGTVGDSKDQLRARINAIMRSILALEGVRVAKAIRALRAARTALRKRFCRRAWVNRLRVAQDVLADNLNYRWWLITLTKKTNGAHDQAVENVSKAFPKLNRKHLKAPGAAAIRSIEFGPKNGNVHIHCLYFGPSVSENILRETWLELTQDSYIVHVAEVGKDKKLDLDGTIAEVGKDKKLDLDGAIAEVTKYITKFTDSEPADIVRYEKALKGRHALQRYGTFRQKKDTTDSTRELVIVTRLPRYPGDKAGGYRGEFERPMCCPNGCGAKMELAPEQPYIPPFFAASGVVGEGRRPKALVPRGGTPLQRIAGSRELATECTATPPGGRVLRGGVVPGVFEAS